MKVVVIATALAAAAALGPALGAASGAMASLEDRTPVAHENPGLQESPQESRLAEMPAGYTALGEPVGPRVTVRALFSIDGIPEDGPVRVTLAGLGASPGPPAVLALTVHGSVSGWFGLVGELRLESSTGLLPGGLAAPGDSGSPGGQYLPLATTISLAPRATFEATLSYDGVTGLVSVSLKNATRNTVLYEGHVHAKPGGEPLFPGFFGTNGHVEPVARRLGLPLGLQRGVQLGIETGNAPPTPLGSAATGAGPVEVYADEPASIAVTGIGPGLPGEFRLAVQAVEEGEGERVETGPGPGDPAAVDSAAVTRAWRAHAEGRGDVVQIPLGALVPGRYRVALQYAEPDYQVLVAEGEIRVIEARLHAELTLEHNEPWSSGGLMAGELVVRADRSVGPVEVQVTAAPDGDASRERLVWNGPVTLSADNPLKIPVSFAVPFPDSPQVFRLALAGEAAGRFSLEPAYRVPRTFYVSPRGDDGWTGHLPDPPSGSSPAIEEEGARDNERDAAQTGGAPAGPFRTVARAQKAVRDLKAAGHLQGPVTVYLRGGTYYLEEPLVFTPADSGSEGAPITYAAYPGETPILSGGVPITEWEEREGGVWAGRLPPPPRGSGGWNFRTLRVGDSWATLARYPNADPDDPLHGGWLFAQWWGDPWERGAFDESVGNIHNVGDRLEWLVDVPAAGEYAVWVRYSHNMSAWGVPDMGGRTAIREEGGTPVPLSNLPDTGGWGNFRWTLAGTLRLEAGERRLVWENTGGGGYNLDALALSNDPGWEPESGITVGGDGRVRVEKDPAAHVLVIQAEAADKAEGKEVTIPPFPEVNGNTTLLRLPRGAFPAWSDWSGAQVHIFPAWGWVNAILPVTSADAQKETLHVVSSQDIRPGNRFFIANVREALDTPGEWYLDRSRGEVLYWPKEEGFPGTTEVVAAFLDRLIVFQSDASGRFVEHIRFRGLTFTDTDYTAPGGYYSHADAAVWLSRARQIAIEDSHFVNLGGYAVRLEQRSHRNEIVGNTMRNLGQGGVIMLGDSASQPYDNLVAANDMADLGLIYKHVAGVYVTTGSGNRIVHNRIHRVPRYGISLKSYDVNASSHDNLVEFNEIIDSNLETNDTGAIETLGRDQRHSGNVIRFNWIENVVGVATTESGEIQTPHFTWGIYLDDYSSGTLVYGNIVKGTVLGAICIHGGRGNVVENNVFLEGRDRQITLQPRDEFMTDNVFRRNIVVYSNAGAPLWYSWAHTWSRDRLSEVDANLYWHTGGFRIDRFPLSISPEGTFTAWRVAGFDRTSRIADPLLLGWSKEDFGLAPDSPAWELGFERIPVELIGPEGYRR